MTANDHDLSLAPAELDQHVREMIAWHFDPRTGSPYWLERASTLGFEPRSAIQGFADLARFPDVADEWRQVPAVHLIPKGCPGPFAVWETGGTTGLPRHLVDAQERFRGLQRIDRILEEHGFPQAGDWLHVGPGGPHLVGTNVRRLAGLRNRLCHTVDLDPRWVKRLYRDGRADEADRYISHVVDQAVTVLKTQPIQVLTTTPPLLQALCAEPTAFGLMQQRLKGIIWFGTSLSEESLRFLEEELLPDTRFVGWYGNTLAGISCQRPRQPGDSYRCIFAPPSPHVQICVTDPADLWQEVPYGQAGRVRIHVLNREVFLPWHAERDTAMRVLPSRPGGRDGVAQVAPLQGAGPRVEGVY